MCVCVCVTCVLVWAGVHAQAGMCVHLYLEGRGHRSASSSIARYITLFSTRCLSFSLEFKDLASQAGQEVPRSSCLSVCPPTPCSGRAVQFDGFWPKRTLEQSPSQFEMKQCLFLLEIPVSIQLPIPFPLQLKAATDLGSAIIVWLLLECSVERAIMEALLAADCWLLAALPGGLVFRVPTIWMYRGSILSVSERHSTSYSTFCLRVLSLIDIPAGLVPAFSCLTKVLWTFMYKSVFWQLFSFPLGKCLVVELLGHLVKIMISFIRNQHSSPAHIALTESHEFWLDPRSSALCWTALGPGTALKWPHFLRAVALQPSNAATL